MRPVDMADCQCTRDPRQRAESVFAGSHAVNHWRLPVGHCSIQRGGQGAPRPRVEAQRCYRLTTETLASRRTARRAPVSVPEGPVNVMTITCRPLNTNRAARTKTLSKMGTSATTWRAGYPFVIKRRSLRSCDLLLRLTSHLMVVSRAVSRMLLALAFLIWSGGRST